MPTLEETWTLRRKTALDAVQQAERRMVDGVLRVTYRSRGRTTDQHGHGITTFPDGTRVAWFAEPDGSTLSVTDHSDDTA